MLRASTHYLIFLLEKKEIEGKLKIDEWLVGTDGERPTWGNYEYNHDMKVWNTHEKVVQFHFHFGPLLYLF